MFTINNHERYFKNVKVIIFTPSLHTMKKVRRKNKSRILRTKYACFKFLALLLMVDLCLCYHYLNFLYIFMLYICLTHILRHKQKQSNDKKNTRRINVLHSINYASSKTRQICVLPCRNLYLKSFSTCTFLSRLPLQQQMKNKKTDPCFGKHERVKGYFINFSQGFSERNLQSLFDILATSITFKDNHFISRVGMKKYINGGGQNAKLALQQSL